MLSLRRHIGIKKFSYFAQETTLIDQLIVTNHIVITVSTA